MQEKKTERERENEELEVKVGGEGWRIEGLGEGVLAPGLVRICTGDIFGSGPAQK